MMHTRPISFCLDQNATLVRAFYSLRPQDAEIVAQVVDALGGTWTIQTHDDYEGYLLMLIEPPAEFTNRLPSFVVSGKLGQIELSAVDGDECQLLGSFGDMFGLTAELTSRLLGVACAF